LWLKVDYVELIKACQGKGRAREGYFGELLLAGEGTWTPMEFQPPAEAQ
jgi:hypothetical protein